MFFVWFFAKKQLPEKDFEKTINIFSIFLAFTFTIPSNYRENHLYLYI